MTPAPQHYDVVIAGGGPAGTVAAIAAARMGAAVSLIERHPMLGGMGTAALVNNFCPAHTDGERLIIGGIFAEIRQTLIEQRALHVTGNIEPYDPEAYARCIANLARDAGATMLLGTSVLAAQRDDDSGRISLRLANEQTIVGDVLIDASGDAGVALQLGTPFRYGRDGDGAVMPLTYCYMMGPIDVDVIERELPAAVRVDHVTGERVVFLSNHPQVNQWVREARDRRELSIPRDHVSVVSSVPGRPDCATVNFGRVFVRDVTDPEQLRAAEKEGLKQVHEGIAFFRRYCPGFENVRLIETARQIGVRQSRQLVGRYTLTADDILSCRQFEDCVAQCAYPIDIHEPHVDTTVMKSLPRGAHYDIPWRCLVPESGPENVVLAGRCISATAEAMSSFRVTPSVMAIGEAAGVTAALAAGNGHRIHRVPPAAVCERLLATGGVLQ